MAERHPRATLVFSGILLLFIAGCAVLWLRDDEHPLSLASTSFHAWLGLLEGATAVAPAPYPRGNAAAPASPAALADANAAALAWTREVEAPLYPGTRKAAPDDGVWPAGLPRVCVALSSGGLRTAALGIGVLQGLADAERLDDVDILSGVSGGAFALYWLHGNAFLTGASTGALTQDGSPALRVVDARPELSGSVRLVSEIAADIGFVPTRLGSRAILAIAGGSEPMLSELGRFYAEALRRIFLVPGTNGKPWLFDRDVTFDQWRAWLREQRPELPFPIVNATIGALGSTGVCRVRKDGSPWTPPRHRLSPYAVPFEFTPLRIGSDAIGYSEAYGRPDGPIDWTDLELSQVIATSGAAPDDPARPNCVKAEALGGFGMSFFDLVTKPLDGPGDGRWGVERHALHLTDGAYAEDLGAFSVIKRLCRTVVIVDNEFDPYLLFDGYFALKRLLAGPSHMQVELTVPSLESLAATTRKVCEGHPECWSRAYAACLENGRCSTSDRLPAHVFRGNVGPFPFPGRPDGLTLDIIHLKTGIVANEVAAYPASVRDLLAAEAAARGTSELRCSGDDVMDIRCPFPQDRLLELSYSASRFATYRAFGRYLAVRHVAPLLQPVEGEASESHPP